MSFTEFLIQGNEFYDKTSNMIGRRHSSSVFLDGHLYVFGGAQPVGYEGTSITLLSSLWLYW